MTYAQYYRELFRLLRGLPQNPVFLATAPWRRASGMRAWFWLNVLVLLAVIALWGYQYFARGADRAAFNVTVFALMLAYPIQWVTTLISFSLSCRTWRSQAAGEDLYLTGLAPREIAFGLQASPSICSLIVPTGWLAGAFWFFITGEDFVGTADVAVILLVLVMMGLSMIALAVIVAVTLHLRFGRKAWPLLAFGPFYYGALVFLCSLTFDALLTVRGFLQVSYAWGLVLRLVVAFCVLAPPIVRGAGRFAGYALFAGIEAADFVRRDPLAINPIEWGRRFLTPVRVSIRGHLPRTRLLSPLTTMALILALAAAATLSGLLYHGQPKVASEFRFGFMRLFNVWTVCALMVLQVVGAELRMLRIGRPIVAGSMLRSLVRPYVPLCLVHAAVWSAMTLWTPPLFEGYSRWYHPAINLVVGGLLLPLAALLVALVFALAVLARGRRPWLAALPTMAAVAILACNVIVPNPALREYAPIPDVSFFALWISRDLYVIGLLIALAQLLRVPGRLTDIYTRLGLGFAEPGTVLYLRREERTGG